MDVIVPSMSRRSARIGIARRYNSQWAFSLMRVKEETYRIPLPAVTTNNWSIIKVSPLAWVQSIKLSV
jgi:hypothetical protein